MTEKPHETEGIIKGGKREPVAQDDESHPKVARTTSTRSTSSRTSRAALPPSKVRDVIRIVA
jgi:hypothetical protein